MGKLHVFEEIGETRRTRFMEPFLTRDGAIHLALYRESEQDYPILRRLTDAEVDALVAPQPADDERGRFIADKAGLILAAMYADGQWAQDHLAVNILEWPDVAKEAAESLAARLFGERTK